MEDRHLIAAELRGQPTESFYSVFDGHGGHQAADYCVKALLSNIISQPNYPEDPAAALTAGFVQTDANFCSSVQSKVDKGDLNANGTPVYAVLCCWGCADWFELP